MKFNLTTRLLRLGLSLLLPLRLGEDEQLAGHAEPKEKMTSISTYWYKGLVFVVPRQQKRGNFSLVHIKPTHMLMTNMGSLAGESTTRLGSTTVAYAVITVNALSMFSTSRRAAL